MQKKKILSLLLLALVSTSFGCANTGSKGKYSCPGLPEGSVCKNPIEVYKATDGPGIKKSGDKTSEVPALTGRMTDPISQPLPVMEPAKVMRIWIAPYIDDKGDLNWPSLLFTEVTPRRWSFGEEVGRDAQILSPLQVDAHRMNTDVPEPQARPAPQPASTQPTPNAQAALGSGTVPGGKPGSAFNGGTTTPQMFAE
jgi:conjugal transfer pilus assembly protein TraV